MTSFCSEVTSDIKEFNSELATLPHVKVYPTLGNQSVYPYYLEGSLTN